MLCRGLCYVGLCCVEQILYGSDAVSARDLIFLCTNEVYVQVRVVISRADLYNAMLQEIKILLSF